MKALRRYWPAAGAAALALLTLLVGGYNPFTPEKGVGLTIREYPDRVVIGQESSDLLCWMRIRFTAVPSPSRVSLSNGTALDVRTYADDRRWLLISAKSAKPWPEKFSWYNGGQIVISGTNLHVDDWSVCPASSSCDSKGKEWRRFLFTGFAIVLFVVSGVVAFRSSAPDVPPPIQPYTPQVVCAEITVRLQIKNPDDTARLRYLVTRAFMNGFKRTFAELERGKDKRLLLQGQQLLTADLARVIDGLDKILQDLQSGEPRVPR